MDIRVLLLFCFVVVAQAEVVKLSCKQIKELLDGHNERRLLLAKGTLEGQPAASEMKSLIWDKELAIKASNWAGKEKYGHNPDRTVPSRRFGTGENIFIVSSNNLKMALNLTAPVGAWWSEHKDYTYKPLANEDFSSPKQIGHYTQMAWSDSTHLGCGVASYVKDGWLNHYVVCNYGPTGNYLGRTPYPKGDPSNNLICGAEEGCRLPYGPKCH